MYTQTHMHITICCACDYSITAGHQASILESEQILANYNSFIVSLKVNFTGNNDYFDAFQKKKDRSIDKSILKGGGEK